MSDNSDWEYKIHSSLLPKDLTMVGEYMTGWSKPIFNFLYLFPSELKRVIKDYEEGKKDIQKVFIKIDPPNHIEEIMRLINGYFMNNE